jgi:hypothetical protein
MYRGGADEYASAYSAWTPCEALGSLQPITSFETSLCWLEAIRELDIK